MRTIIAGNWKMNKDRSEALDLIEDLVKLSGKLPPNVEMMIAPAFPFLDPAVERVRGTHIIVAAQNCHEAKEGAFTGEVNVHMLKSIGVGACIVGHSERRQFFNETDPIVAKKIRSLLEHGLTPVYCCGEVKEERASGEHFNVVGAQINAALSGFDQNEMARIVIAYEPVWAIGTGLTASPEQAQEMHAFIRAQLRSMVNDVADAIPILYGGSCKPDNAESLFKNSDVNGGLIGGASLEADQFMKLAMIAGRIK
ncbi:MAG: triose-phosphate isomerase [Bacteroidota bacterium]|nr:triose-phosphate isomerase [Bacteroidota bacterium]